VGIAIVDSGAPALASAPVATTATLAAEAIEGCVVLVVVIIAVGAPTVTGAVSGRPGTGSHLIRREGTLRNSKNSNDGLSDQQACIPDGVSDTDA